MAATDSRTEGANEDRSEAGFGDFEVVTDGDGFGVIRRGDPQPISHHAKRAEAEEAARLHSSDGTGIDARKDIFSGGEADSTSAKHTFAGVGIFAVAVIALIVVIALFVAL